MVNFAGGLSDWVVDLGTYVVVEDTGTGLAQHVAPGFAAIDLEI